MVFQMAPDTEAPAKMLIYFPKLKALCAAEDATHTFHNILTLRGAIVCDLHSWTTHLTDTIDMFGGQPEVVFASHHWEDHEILIVVGWRECFDDGFRPF